MKVREGWEEEQMNTVLPEKLAPRNMSLMKDQRPKTVSSRQLDALKQGLYGFASKTNTGCCFF